MTTQHTPGPWKYGVRKDRSIWLSLGDPKVAGAAHYQGDFVGTEADARLIVTALELLEACVMAIGLIKLQRDIIEQGKHSAAWNPAVEQLAAAIAKATGAA